MTKPGANTYIIVPSESKATIEIRKMPYDREKHYKLGRRLGKFLLNSTTGGFWEGLAETVAEWEKVGG